MPGEIDYGELFGVELKGENKQEAAEPAKDTESQGEEVKEAAEPSADSIEPKPEADEPKQDEAEGEGEKQSKEDNAKFAAIRRKYEQERDEAIQKAKEDMQSENAKVLDEMIRNARMMNPYTRKPIESKAEYDEYLARRNEERAKANRDKLGMNEKEYERFVSDLPEVQEAKALKEQAEAEKKAAEEAKFQVKVNEEIKNISMLDPTISSIADLAKQEYYPQLLEKVKAGMSIEDAFKLVNFSRFMNEAGNKSRQAALNNVNGKSHMTKTEGRGTGAIPVPAETKEMYRALIPGITDAEISEHYNREHKV